MKKIKISIFFAMIIFSTKGYCFWNAAGTEFVKEANNTLNNHLPTLQEIMKTLGNNVTDAAKVVGSDAAKSLGSDAAKELANVAVDASIGLGGDAASKLSSTITNAVDKLEPIGQGIVVIAGVGVAVHSVMQLYPIGKEIVSSICPSEEQKILNAKRL